MARAENFMVWIFSPWILWCQREDSQKSTPWQKKVVDVRLRMRKSGTNTLGTTDVHVSWRAACMATTTYVSLWNFSTSRKTRMQKVRRGEDSHKVFAGHESIRDWNLVKAERGVPINPKPIDWKLYPSWSRFVKLASFFLGKFWKLVRLGLMV